MSSIDTINLLLLSGAALVLIGIVSSLVANRFGAPLLLVFLFVGMLVGEDGPGGIVFNDYAATFFVGSLALAVILFDGGLRTKFSAFRGTLSASLLLATAGVIVTAVLTGGVAMLIFGDLDPVEALLLGSIVASTDAAAVFFLLRSAGLQLQPRVGGVLEIESGTNDPMAVFLTIVLTELALAGAWAPGWSVLSRLAVEGALGGAFGVLGGLLAVWFLNRVDLPVGLHPLFAVTAAVLIYALTASLHGSGFLAVYIAGLLLANLPVRAYPSILAFHDATTWLCQIGMFLVLGLLVTPTKLVDYILPGLAIAVFLTLVPRPAAVWLCLAPLKFNRKEMIFISWVGLRGAVTIFLAAIPTLARLPHAEVYFNIAFFVVLFSLLVQGWTISLGARGLGLALRRKVPAVSRIELDIPGQVEREMVGYPIGSESLVLGLTRLPGWAQLVLVVRGGEILTAADAGFLEAGDYAYFLVGRERVARLDRLFGDTADLSRRMGSRFGELSLNGEAQISEVARLYDLEVLAEDGARSVAAFFESHLRGRPQPGHRLPLGRATIVVRSVQHGKVTRAGLQLEEMFSTLFAGALARRPRIDQFPAPLQRLIDWLTRNKGRTA